MNASDIQHWAQLILAGMRAGQLDIAPLAGHLNVTEGERVQLAVLEHHRGTGESLAGWKVGLTSGVSRDAFGVGVRPFGHLLASRVLRSGATIAREAIPNLGLENELCFRLGKSVRGESVTPDAVGAAVETVAPAFEINQSRTGGQADPGTRAADNLSQWGIVVGPESPLPKDSGWIDFDALTVTLTRDGSHLGTVSARGHIDDHFESMAALVRELAKFGLGLEAGQRIITGAYTRIAVEEPGTYLGTFSGLSGSGAVSIVVT